MREGIADEDRSFSPRRRTLCTSSGRERTKRVVPLNLAFRLISGHRRETECEHFIKHTPQHLQKG